VPYRGKKLTFAISSPDEFLFKEVVEKLLRKAMLSYCHPSRQRMDSSDRDPI